MRVPTFHLERELIAAGSTPIGVDEAGCGCLAGPVVAAAVHLPLDSRLGLIRDSKLLSAVQRERLLAVFAARGYRWAVGVATHAEVDRVNIRQATYLAMRRAVRALLESGIRNHESGTRHSRPDIRDSRQPYALVDAWTIPDLSIPQRGIVHGDRLVKSIAAASIIAKVTRDRMMDDLDLTYPAYGFAVHRGYATPAHRAAIIRFGLSPVHRLTFCADTARFHGPSRSQPLQSEKIDPVGISAQ